MEAATTASTGVATAAAGAGVVGRGGGLAAMANDEVAARITDEGNLLDLFCRHAAGHIRNNALYLFA